MIISLLQLKNLLMIISYYTLFKFISKFHLLRYFLREEKSCLHFKRNVASRNEAFSPWQCQFVRFIVTALHRRGQLPVTNRSFFDLKPFLFPSFLFFPFPFPFSFSRLTKSVSPLRGTHTRINPFYPAARATIEILFTTMIYHWPARIKTRR